MFGRVKGRFPPIFCNGTAISMTHRRAVIRNVRSIISAKIQTAAGSPMFGITSPLHFNSKTKLVTVMDDIVKNTALPFRLQKLIDRGNADEQFSTSADQIFNMFRRYTGPKVVVEDDKIAEVAEKNAEILREVIPKVDAILPYTTSAVKIKLLDIMADNNIRDLKFIDRICDSLCSVGRNLKVSEMEVLLYSLSRLGAYHAALMSPLKRNLLRQIKQTESEDRDNEITSLVHVISSFAHLRVNDTHMWSEIAAWSCKNMRTLKRHLFDLHRACTLVNLPLASFAPLSTEVALRMQATLTKATSLKRPYEVRNRLALAHSLLISRSLTKKIAMSLLTVEFLEHVNQDIDPNCELTWPTLCYNMTRMWNISVAAESIIGQKSGSFFNPMSFFLSNPKKEEIIWKLKYSQNMSPVESFRRLLHEVAPLGTHSTPHYLHKRRGVLVEADVLVSSNEILPLSSAELPAKSKKSRRVHRVAVLFFTENHTMRVDKSSSKICLTGSNQLTIYLLTCPLPGESAKDRRFPVVFTQVELDALADDTARKELIRHRIANLSRTFHKETHI